MNLKFLDKFRDLGILTMRAGLGLMFMFHGFPLLVAGPSEWASLGSVMGTTFGFEFMPVVWGFLGVLILFFGGMALLIGLFTRVACILLTSTMLIEVLFEFSNGEGLSGASYGLQMAIVFFGLLLIGPGRLSIDARETARSPRPA